MLWKEFNFDFEGATYGFYSTSHGPQSEVLLCQTFNPLPANVENMVSSE